jgi:hypothetical protein
MAAIFPRWWLINLAGPVVLILAGILVVVRNVVTGALFVDPIREEMADAAAE